MLFRSVVKAHRDLEQTIVLTQGTYDMVHVGHGRYLQDAKKRGDVLIVGVDSNTSEEIDYGKRSLIFRNTYLITIDSEPYVLHLKECIIDDKHEENIGVIRLTVFFDEEGLGMPREYVGGLWSIYFLKGRSISIRFFNSRILPRKGSIKWKKVQK